MVKTVSYECPYLPGKTTTVEISQVPDSGFDFSKYLDLGYRRMGMVIYRNVCEGCTECVSLRIPVREFCPSKSQRRTLRQNGDLETRIFKIMPQDAVRFIRQRYFGLYIDYERTKHERTENADEHFRSFVTMYSSVYPFYSLEIFEGDRAVGVSLLDEGSNALSSNYFYYDSALTKRRLGVYSILKEVDTTRAAGKDYLHLGFYVDGCHKMSYKSAYYPHERLIDGEWVRFEKPHAE